MDVEYSEGGGGAFSPLTRVLLGIIKLFEGSGVWTFDFSVTVTSVEWTLVSSSVSRKYLVRLRIDRLVPIRTKYTAVERELKSSFSKIIRRG